jgi:hypothetical protein
MIDAALPQQFFDDILAVEECSHPWDWFFWSYPDGGPAGGLPVPRTVKARQWCLDNQIELDDPCAGAYTKQRRYPEMEAKFAEHGLVFPYGIWTPDEEQTRRPYIVCVIATPFHGDSNLNRVHGLYDSFERIVSQFLCQAARLGAPMISTNKDIDGGWGRQITGEEPDRVPGLLNSWEPYLDSSRPFEVHVCAEQYVHSHDKQASHYIRTELEIEPIKEWIRENTKDN